MIASRLNGADVILLAPAVELAESAELVGYAPNKSPGLPVYASPLEATMDLYAGASRFLVRTALVRAEGWSDRAKAPLIKSGRDAAKLCAHLAQSDVEYMISIALGPKMELRAIHEVTVGGRSNASFALEQIVKVATLASATAMIIVHNHPSGDPTPSAEDIVMTRKVNLGARCIDIQLVDHVIIGSREGASDVYYKSFMESKIEPFDMDWATRP